MLPVVTSQEMRAVDQHLINVVGMGSLQLMEHAARGVRDAIASKIDGSSRVLIVAGPGNNGGDGLALARLLIEAGFDIHVCLSDPEKLSTDARAQLHVLRSLVSEDRFLDLDAASRFNPTLIIDALLGTGSSGPPRGKIAEAIRAINHVKEVTEATVVAVDIPSGLNADTGSWSEELVVRADLTVTIGLPKLGFYQRNAAAATGDIVVAGLGYPLADVTASPARLVDRQSIIDRFPSRSAIGSKFSFGRVFALAGSRGMTGAAIMSATSALKAGCGLVNVAVPESERSLVAQAMPELLTVGCSENEEGYPTADRYDVLEPHIEHADAIMIGPGLRRVPGATELMLKIIREVQKPMVIDAGAIAALQGDPSPLAARTAPTIVTPHSGELSRLTGVEWQTVEDDRLNYAIQFAKDYGVTVVSKGAPTYTVSSHGEVYINTTGNSGLATAGSGDVLAGVIAGTFVQLRDNPLDAAMIGVYVHGLAGDLAARDLTSISMTAMDVQRYLPMAYKALGQE